jgi:hypothetical protein
MCGGRKANGSGKLGSFELESGLFGELPVHLGELQDMFPTAYMY